MSDSIGMTLIFCVIGEGAPEGIGGCSWFTGALLVLRIPVRGRFMRPFDVAGLGARYLRTKSAFINGTPCNWPLLMALINVCAGGLKKDWCTYFSCCCLNGNVYRFAAY